MFIFCAPLLLKEKIIPRFSVRSHATLVIDQVHDESVCTQSRRRLHSFLVQSDELLYPLTSVVDGEPM